MYLSFETSQIFHFKIRLIMEQKLDDIRTEALAAIKAAENIDTIEEIRIKYLGRKGALTLILRSLGNIPPEKRASFGKLSNRYKNEIEAAIENKKESLSTTSAEDMVRTQWIDVTLDHVAAKAHDDLGRLHPISQMQYEIEDIFTSMGFEIHDGPEVETDYYNFEALNIPKHHPARDMQDTFWTEDGNLLRTHTSAIQIRAMEKVKPPFRIVGPGRVFRYESTDASHENTFYQVEGMMVDREITVANLIFVMKELLKEIFQREVAVRLRPGYFPFVEPGFELDIHCLICDGTGCSVCKQSGWVELLPCGLVHPNVLRMGGINPEEWSGFAFGLGLNRLAMMKYGINDIRHFLSGDIRFLKQF